MKLAMTPMQFVNRVKLSSIRTLMAKEGVKLYEAAEMFGYTDPNYVSKLFKKYYGMNITASLTQKDAKLEEELEAEIDHRHPKP